MKLNWFTPLPPAHSDIAKSVERILPALQARADLTLWCDAPVSRSLRRQVEVRRYTPERIRWRELNHADHTLYNVGNDGRFHASIMQVAQRHPGIVILHDLSIHELALHTLKLGAAWRERYFELMEARGPAAADDARAYLEGRVTAADLATRHPLGEWALQGAHGVVVHNGELFRQLHPDIDPPCLDTPLPYLPSDALPAPRARQRGDGPLQLVICGFLNSPNRRLAELLAALAAYPRRNELRLHICGHIHNGAELKARMRTLGLGRIVRLHGYVGARRLAKILDAAHLAVNLRFPSRGEASGAQLRFWSHSLPTLVTRTGWYARLPEDSVLHVDPDHEARDLHVIWTRALDDYDSLARAGLCGRQLLASKHSAETFVDALLAFLPAVEDYRRRAFAPSLAARAGAALAGLSLPGNAREVTAGSTAAAIARICEPIRQPRRHGARTCCCSN